MSRAICFLAGLALLAACSKPYSMDAYSVEFELLDEAGNPRIDFPVVVYNPHPCDRASLFDEAREVEVATEKGEELLTDAEGRVVVQVPAIAGHCGFPLGSPNHWTYSDSVLPNPLGHDVSLYFFFPKAQVALFQLAGSVGPREPRVLAPALGVPEPFDYARFSFSSQGGEHGTWLCIIHLAEEALTRGE